MIKINIIIKTTYAKNKQFNKLFKEKQIDN